MESAHTLCVCVDAATYDDVAFCIKSRAHLHDFRYISVARSTNVMPAYDYQDYARMTLFIQQVLGLMHSLRRPKTPR